MAIIVALSVLNFWPANFPCSAFDLQPGKTSANQANSAFHPFGVYK